MDITVYLPDDLAQRAKAKPRGFISGVLREALEARFAEEDAVSATLEDAGTVTLDLTTEEGRAYRGRMAATLIGEDAEAGSRIYLRQGGEVIAYRPADRRYRIVEHPQDELVDVLPTNEYIAAMAALGIVPEIDLDARPAVAVPPATRARPAAAAAGLGRLRSVPGDLVVEPSVNLLKRLTGHGDAAKEAPPAAKEAPPAAEEPPRLADEPSAAEEPPTLDASAIEDSAPEAVTT